MHYKMNTVLNFGKYKGKSIKEVMKIDGTYVDWMVHKFIDDTFAKDVQLEAHESYEDSMIDHPLSYLTYDGRQT